ncbi:TonB-dependent receptor domain-containing protein [Terrihabitans sp. B22-R8]|uniref:TonB-dependent receptor domain-containing protein n=1 Tax=Terrihabitans sp. B22-R8 TaxID=3425128 RepID=UPI00403C4AAC
MTILRGKGGVSRMRTAVLAGVALIAVQAAAPEARAQGAGTAVTLDIPAKPLPRALADLSARTGLQVLYSGNTAQGLTSRPLRGTYSARQAVAILLQGTGIAYRFVGPNSVSLGGPAVDNGPATTGAVDDGMIQLETIEVGGGGGAPSSGGIPDSADAPYEMAGSKSYITMEQVQQNSGQSSGDIFKSTPGVIAAGNRNGSALDVNIRGMQGQNRVKVAIDGTQQTSTTWRGYIGVDERVYVDPDMIGGVGISKGPTGGAEGAGSTGGVVAIRTLNANDIVKDGNEYGVRLRASTNDNAVSTANPLTFDPRTDGSDFDFTNGSISAAAATVKENYDFVFAAAKRTNGNYFAGKHGDSTYAFGYRPDYPLSFTGPGEEVFNSSEDTLSFLAKGTLRWADDHSLQLGYVHYESEFGESMGSMFFQQADGWRQVKLANIITDTYTARYRWNPGDDLFDLRANIWASDVRGTTRSVTGGPRLDYPGYELADNPRYSETWTYGGDVTNTSRIATGFGDFSVDYGASYLLEDANGHAYCSATFVRDTCFPRQGGAVEMQPSVGTREVGSVFSNGTWEVTDWLKFDAGLRYDTYQLKDESPMARAGRDEHDGARLNPSASVTVTPIQGLQFFAAYSEGVRPPTLRETMFSDGNVLANPGLDPELAKNWEFGINGKADGLLFAQDKARVKLAYFDNNYEDYISRRSFSGPWEPGEPRWAFTFENLDRAAFSGIELSGSYDTGMFFSQWALTYYTDFEFCRTSGSCEGNTQDSDYAVNHLPPEIAASLTLGMRLFDEKLQFGTRIIHNGERLAPLKQSDRQRTAYWLPYTVVDAFASYKINDEVTVDVKAENLFDRYYVDALDGWMPSPGRTIRATMTAHF